eukprot:TRINITY_DN2741_c0_g1_i3.p1 TRINITY_DN2741_c0_g1~~TRINITY_DN2741_c0_g1_i3.p1  ORF type:complete len:786 (+),score=62.94 TRINITY_DN2741_c0_g1_i3:692-3049(+)
MSAGDKQEPELEQPLLSEERQQEQEEDFRKELEPELEPPLNNNEQELENEVQPEQEKLSLDDQSDSSQKPVIDKEQTPLKNEEQEKPELQKEEEEEPKLVYSRQDNDNDLHREIESFKIQVEDELDDDSEEFEIANERAEDDEQKDEEFEEREYKDDDDSINDIEHNSVDEQLLAVLGIKGSLPETEPLLSVNDNDKCEKKTIYSLQDRLAHAILLIFQGLLGEHDKEVRRDTAARNAYYYYYYFRSSFSLAALALVILTIFEPASWCVISHGFTACQNISKENRTFGIPICPVHISFIVEFLLLAFLTIEIYIQLFIQGKNYVKFALNNVTLIVFGVYIIDLICAVIVAIVFNIPWVRIAPYLRIIIFGLRSQTVRRQIRLFVGLLGNFLLVVFVMCFVVAVFALFAVVLLPQVLVQDVINNSKVSETGQFASFTWMLYVVASTDDVTDTLQDQIYSHIAYFLLFLLYVIIVMLFLYNLIIAVVYKSYMDGMKSLIKRDRELMIGVQQKVWEELDDENKGYISLSQFKQLLFQTQHYAYFRNLIKVQYIDMKIWAMDLNNDKYINKIDFNELIAVFRLQFYRVDEPTFMQIWCRCIARTKCFKDYCKFVQSIYFEGIIFFGLLVVAAYTFYSFWAVLYGFPDIDFNFEFEAGIAIFFVLEALIRILAMGWKRYWNKHTFDFFIMIISFLPVVFLQFESQIEQAVNSDNAQYVFLKFLAVFYALQIPGLLRFIRIFLVFSWFVTFYRTFIKMLGASYKLICLLFCFMYIFSIVGAKPLKCRRQNT